MITKSLDGKRKVRDESLSCKGLAGLKRVRKKRGGWMAAEVPGEIHLDLMRPALLPSWDRAAATVKRGNDEYRVRIERTDGGEPEVLLNGKKWDGTFVPFQGAETHEIVVCVR